MVELGDMEKAAVVGGGRRVKPSAEMEERASKISWKKGMVMGSVTDEAKSHLLRVFSSL